MEPIARTPAPPYYAVVFTSRRTADDEGYADMAREMEELAARQPGFLGTESVRAPEGVGITVSYWTSADAVRAWKTHAEHRVAQRLGREKWYAAYRIRVCRVERDYGFEA